MSNSAVQDWLGYNLPPPLILSAFLHCVRCINTGVILFWSFFLPGFYILFLIFIHQMSGQTKHLFFFSTSLRLYFTFTSITLPTFLPSFFSLPSRLTRARCLHCVLWHSDGSSHEMVTAIRATDVRSTLGLFVSVSSGAQILVVVCCVCVCVCSGGCRGGGEF